MHRSPAGRRRHRRHGGAPWPSAAPTPPWSSSKPAGRPRPPPPASCPSANACPATTAPPPTQPLRPAPGGIKMTTTMTDTAALASIGAATRELRLPVGARRGRPPRRGGPRARPGHLPGLPRRGPRGRGRRARRRRRQRRMHEARFPRLKRLADFDLPPRPRSTRPTIAPWRPAPTWTRRARRAARRLGHRQEPPVDRARPGGLRAGTLGPLRHLCPARERARRSRRRTSPVPPRRPLRPARPACAWTSSATSARRPGRGAAVPDH